MGSFLGRKAALKIVGSVSFDLHRSVVFVAATLGFGGEKEEEDEEFLYLWRASERKANLPSRSSSDGPSNSQIVDVGLGETQVAQDDDIVVAV
ncbi:unnamed protein product [Vicia faba]|uniref:Uncharacterized protein n=1 Tax=Vicia faba TaxID=3906 RepID=A0AAV0YDU4_VICFA|nr:unnamed protein product [Vicia faba]